MGHPPSAKHWLLWDGECGFCRKWVEWFAARDAGRRFRIVPYQEAPSPPMTPLLRVQASRALQIITSHDVQYSGGRAILFALAETGWHPRLTRLAMRRPIIWPVELGYRVVAANRPFFSRLVPRG